MNGYFHVLFSKLHSRFRKGFNAQHCLLVLVEKCCEIPDKWVMQGSCLLI